MNQYESQEEADYFEGSAKQEIPPTPEDSTPQPTNGSHEYNQVEAGDKCSVCGEGRLSHIVAQQPTTMEPSKSEERCVICEQRPDLPHHCKNSLNPNMVTPSSHPDTLRIDGKEKMKQFMSVLATRDNYCTSNIEGAKSILPMAQEAIDSLLSQEKERIEDKWGKAWAELVDITDKETKKLKERWENELRENIIRVGTYDENNKTWIVVYTKVFVDSLTNHKPS